MKYDFPKIDLHLHLDGSMLPDSAWEMAEERGVKMPADNPEDFKKFIVVTADCRDVNEYLEKFELPLQIMQDREAIIRTARELVIMLAEQGLVYAEIRFAPQLHTRKGHDPGGGDRSRYRGRKRGHEAGENNRYRNNMLYHEHRIGNRK